MAITQAVCTSFKQEILVETHDFTATTGDTFKLALYSSSATLSASTPLIPVQMKFLLQEPIRLEVDH